MKSVLFTIIVSTQIKLTVWLLVTAKQTYRQNAKHSNPNRTLLLISLILRCNVFVKQRLKFVFNFWWIKSDFGSNPSRAPSKSNLAFQFLEHSPPTRLLDWTCTAGLQQCQIYAQHLFSRRVYFGRKSSPPLIVGTWVVYKRSGYQGYLIKKKN